jgi:hypothetical protein
MKTLANSGLPYVSTAPLQAIVIYQQLPLYFILQLTSSLRRRLSDIDRVLRIRTTVRKTGALRRFAI